MNHYPRGQEGIFKIAHDDRADQEITKRAAPRAWFGDVHGLQSADGDAPVYMYVRSAEPVR
jgi:hypothetical protein